MYTQIRYLGTNSRTVVFALLIGLMCLADIILLNPLAEAANTATLQPCANSIEPGMTMTCQISAAAEVDTLTLLGNSGEIYLLRVGVTAGELRPQLRFSAPGGTTICQTSNFYSPGVEIARCEVTQSGLQTISVSDAAANRTGSYNLYIQRLSAPVNPTALTIGTTHTSVIAAVAEATTFTLAGTANEAYLLRMGVTAGELRPNLRVIGRDGTVVCTENQPYAPGSEITRCVLPQSGTYTVLATDTSAVHTGSYNLYVQRTSAPAGATALEIGTTATATIQAGSEADTFSLTGSANEVYLLRMGVTAGELRPALRVFNSDGSVMCQVLQPYALGAEIMRCLLPQNGTYTVLATDTSVVKTGSYNLYVQRLTAPVGVTAISWGETTAATVQMAAELDSYTLQAAANDVLLIRVGSSAGELRSTVTVFDPDGVNLCTASEPYRQGIEITRCLIPRDGSFLVVVGDTSATKTGSYSLYIQRLTAPANGRVVTSGETLAGAIQTPAEADTLRWSAGASDRLRITVATNGEFRPSVRVFDPAGTKVCEASNFFSPSAEIPDCLLPRSGVYTVLVGDTEAIHTGAYRVSLACLSNPCGTPYTAVLGAEGGCLQAGELEVVVPPGAFNGATTLSLTPLVSTANPGTGQLIRGFALVARNNDGSLITTTAQPITYTYHLQGLELQSQGISLTNLRLSLWDTTSHNWSTTTNSVSGTTISTNSLHLADVALLLAQTSPSRQHVFLPMVLR